MSQKNTLINIVVNHLLRYPTPFSITYFWNFGSLAAFCLVIQILSGLFLAMHYSADITLAFNSVEHIMRDVNYGWLLRYTHANGASMFLLVVYLHMARGVFYKSFHAPREHLWYSGLGLFVLLMATAFLGYVLPWGQMSFWGATVITNLASAIPVVGQTIAYWLWGGFAVDNATLTRFFALHFLIPFLMAGLTLLHIALLHVDGSSNPIGVDGLADYIPFYPYFLIKDFYGFFIFLFVFSYLVFFDPNLLGHPDNYIKANPLVTPAHIVPEWYFLPFYAILRAVPDKLGGVIAMGLSIGIFFALPLLSKLKSFLNPGFSRLFGLENKVCLICFITEWDSFRAPRFNVYHSYFFALWIVSFILLGVLGGKPVEYPYSELSVFTAFYYFFYLVFLL